MTIHPAKPDNSASIARLAGQLGYSSEAGAMQARLERLMESDENAVFVAQDQQTGIAGWAHVERRAGLLSEPFAELCALVVDEGCRRTGVGEALLVACVRWSRDRGLARLRVRSRADRAESHPFYLKQGFALNKTQAVYDMELPEAARGEHS